MRTEHLFPDQDALFTALYAFCVEALLGDLLTSAQVSCFLSGGNTPRPLYSRLAVAALPWQHIHPALADERWVAVSNPASNEGLLRDCFRDNQIFLDKLCGMKDAAEAAELAESACSARYAALPAPYSFSLLGLGADGHTASLFPHAEGLAAALESPAFCKAIKAQPSAVTGPNIERMTLTLASILKSRRIILLFTGHEKWQVYQDALHCHDREALPASAVLQQTATPVHVFYCK